MIRASGHDVYWAKVFKSDRELIDHYSQQPIIYLNVLVAFICGVFFCSKETFFHIWWSEEASFVGSSLRQPMIRSNFICGNLRRGEMIRRDLASFAPRDVNSTWLSQYICSQVSSTDRPDWKGIADYIAGSTSGDYKIEILCLISQVHLPNWPDLKE